MESREIFRFNKILEKSYNPEVRDRIKGSELEKEAYLASLE